MGIYLFFRPAILVRDVNLIKHILVKDFQHFHDRGVYCDPIHDPFSANLFALPGEEWKKLRTKLTPAFTSGKLKNMFPTILDVGHELNNHIKPLAEAGDTIDIRVLAGRYVVDVLANVAFGVDVSTINNPEHEFAQNGRKLNNKSILSIIRGAGIFVCPK